MNPPRHIFRLPLTGLCLLLLFLAHCAKQAPQEELQPPRSKSPTPFPTSAPAQPTPDTSGRFSSFSTHTLAGRVIHLGVQPASTELSLHVLFPQTEPGLRETLKALRLLCSKGRHFTFRQCQASPLSTPEWLEFQATLPSHRQMEFLQQVLLALSPKGQEDRLQPTAPRHKLFTHQSLLSRLQALILGHAILRGQELSFHLQGRREFWTLVGPLEEVRILKLLGEDQKTQTEDPAREALPNPSWESFDWEMAPAQELEFLLAWQIRNGKAQYPENSTQHAPLGQGTGLSGLQFQTHWLLQSPENWLTFHARNSSAPPSNLQCDAINRWMKEQWTKLQNSGEPLLQSSLHWPWPTLGNAETPPASPSDGATTLGRHRFLSDPTLQETKSRLENVPRGLHPFASPALEIKGPVFLSGNGSAEQLQELLGCLQAPH